VPRIVSVENRSSQHYEFARASCGRPSSFVLSYFSFINRPLVSTTLFFAGKSTTARSAAVTRSRSSLILARNHIAAPPNRLIRMIYGGDHKAVSWTLEPKGLLAAESKRTGTKKLDR
jgi:hypothetical protein